tara:strand:+ start:432 stop:1562 length:1131 start_codon:yes stop_codon:yes gene_type:complete
MSYQLQPNAMSSKILYIDSRDAEIYLQQKNQEMPNGVTETVDLTSYFQYTIAEKIEVPTNQRALISLNSATIPYSFYNIRTGINDKIQIKATNLTGGSNSSAPLTFSAGNYTAYSFASVIETFINSASIQFDGGGITFDFEMNFDTDKQKFQYILKKKDTTPASANNNIKLEFLFADETAQETPHIEMGFRPDIDVAMEIPASLAGEAAEDILFSTNVVDMNGSIHGVYIRTNLVSNGTLDTQSGTFSNILARIPIDVNSGGILFATPNNATHKSIVDLRSIDTLTIRLSDERNRVLDLNGLHFQVAIAIDFVYGEKKHVIPMGHLSKSGGGHSFHRNDIESRDNRLSDYEYQVQQNAMIQQLQKTKIKKEPKKKK